MPSPSLLSSTDPLFLVGFPGCGKSTVGPLLAELLKRPFLDLDAHIEKAAGKRISEIFAAHGEEGFRRMETEALENLSVLKPAHIIAVGGGTPCRQGNLKMMQSLGSLLYIEVPADALVSRLRTGIAARPMLHHHAHELEVYVNRTLSERIPFYTQAKWTVSGASPPEVVARRIAEILSAHE